MKRHMAITTALTALIVISSCTLAGDPVIPTELTASVDLHNKIELNWKEDTNAGVYYIYRSDSDTITGTEEEYIGSAAMNAFIDTSVETDVTYWYAVSAADPFGGNETAISDPASGIAPDYIWSGPETVIEASSGAVFAAGGTVPTVVSAASAGGSVTHYERDDENGWAAAGEPAGTTGSPSYLTAAVIGGDLHTAFTDSAAADVLTVRLYNGENGWETVGEAGAADVAGPISLIGSAGFPDNELTVGYIDTFNEVSVKTYPGTTYEWSDVDSVGLSSSTAADICMFNDATYVIYENSNNMGIKVYNEDTVAWDTITSPGTGNIADGYLSCLAGNDGIYAAFSISANTISVMKYAEGSWESLPTPSTGATITTGLLDMEVLNGTLYAAYVTATETVVSRYVDEAWEITAVNPDDTLAAADGLDLEVHGGSLRLLTVTGGKVEVRTFE